MPVEFHVINLEASFKLILGRRWIEQTKCVPSVYHQCIKFPYQGKIYRVFSDEPPEEYKSDNLPNLPIIKEVTTTEIQPRKPPLLWSPLLTSTSHGMEIPVCWSTDRVASTPIPGHGQDFALCQMQRENRRIWCADSATNPGWDLNEKIRESKKKPIVLNLRESKDGLGY